MIIEQILQHRSRSNRQGASGNTGGSVGVASGRRVHGSTEAACTVIVEQRPCDSGMPWKGEGADAVLSFRRPTHTLKPWERSCPRMDRYGFSIEY